MANAIGPRVIQIQADLFRFRIHCLTPVDHIVGLRLRLADPHRTVFNTRVATISNRPTIILNMLLSMRKAQTDCGPGGDESPLGG